MKYSIIVPVYNSESSLVRCIDSLINQTYTNLEFIFVNDGSNDSSLDILKSYKDKRISIIDQKNSGGIIARKNGYLKSNGDYVIFIDSDDYIELDTFEKLNNYVIKYKKPDLIKFRFISEPLNKESKKLLDKNTLLKGKYNKFIYDELMYTKDFNNIWNSIEKRELINFNDDIYSKIVRKGEDLVINLQLFKNINNCLIINDLFYHYQTDSNGITNNYKYSKVINNLIDNMYIVKYKEKLSKDINYDLDYNKLYEKHYKFAIKQIKKYLLSKNYNYKELKLIYNELNNNNYFKDYNININKVKLNIIDKYIGKSLFNNNILLLRLIRLYLKIRKA